MPEVAKWLRNAELIHHEHAPARVMVERDFNYLHSRLWGPGYVLVGDAGGFLDPLFTFGVFMAATGAQLAAYAIGTLLDERAVGATEELVLGGYEQHIRTYYGAFAAMLYVFYRFNGDRSDYWRTARDLIQRESLPANITDREAFMALTFGYGVNTYVFHEATQHFGQVAMRRIFDMGNSEDAPIAWSDPGEFGGKSLDDECRPVLLQAPGDQGNGDSHSRDRPHDPHAPTGVRHAARTGRFPRHVYAPDWLSEIVCGLDGSRTVRELTASLAPGRVRFGAKKLERRDVLQRTLRMLHSLGVARTRSDEAMTARVMQVSGEQLSEFLRHPPDGPDRVEVTPPAAQLGAAETGPVAASSDGTGSAASSRRSSAAYRSACSARSGRASTSAAPTAPARGRCAACQVRRVLRVRCRGPR